MKARQGDRVQRGGKTLSAARGAAARPLEAFGRLPAALQAGVVIVGLVATLLTSVTAILTTGSELPHTWDKFINTVHPPPAPSKTVVFVSSDRVLALSYLSVLSDSGFTDVDLLDPSQIGELTRLRPGIVIIGDSQADAQLPVLSDQLHTLLTNETRVFGMGALGARLFDLLEPLSPLGLRHATGLTTTAVRLAANSSKTMRANLPVNQSFSIFQSADENGIAIHDAGSLDVLQARRLAEATIDGDICGGHFYPVMQHGDYYMWGYSEAATNLTDMGKRLFVDLVSDAMQAPLATANVNDHFFEPGAYRGTLACGYNVDSYALDLTGSGALNVRVTSRQPLELVVTGPGSANVARTEVVSPRINQRANLRSSDEIWLVTIAYRGTTTQSTRVSYDVDIQYPARPARRFPPWAVVVTFVVASAVTLAAGFVLIRRLMYHFQVHVLGRLPSGN